MKCAVCSYVTPAPSTAQQPRQQALPPPRRTPEQLEQQYQQVMQQPLQQSAAGSSKQTQTVLVENPAGVDESGNEVRPGWRWGGCWGCCGWQAVG